MLRHVVASIEGRNKGRKKNDSNRMMECKALLEQNGKCHIYRFCALRQTEDSAEFWDRQILVGGN